MLKYILLFALSFSVHAHQKNQQIVDYCKRMMLKDGGHVLVLACVKDEIQARNKLDALLNEK